MVRIFTITTQTLAYDSPCTPKMWVLNFRPKITIKHSLFEDRALNLPLDLARNFRGGGHQAFLSSPGTTWNSYPEIKRPHFRRRMGYND
jgi:hypothetical protein